jgi:uncharacterized integral membrane protein
MFYRALAVVFLLMSGLFVLQNVEPVYVKFLFWNIRTFLAMALSLSFLLGFATATLVFLALKMKHRFERSKEEKSGNPPQA